MGAVDFRSSGSPSPRRDIEKHVFDFWTSIPVQYHTSASIFGLEFQPPFLFHSYTLGITSRSEVVNDLLKLHLGGIAFLYGNHTP
ncbi:hypothetical protein LshimejAT787_0502790 [Lyophyllum shimeji]|uniref:Uncharacterized protein n=1 Tax=Lyophyllum shimeji TaxID=47721 RepID=A0A9P3PN02_LYOSH|nr:hypothetical protein LshimejAT787_0502790 [Lyophyllum shimeji]